MTYPKFTKPTEYKKGGKKKKKSSSKPKPTNPSLWSRAKSMARQKFDVYPSAYANAWAAKWYKSKGGGWSGGSKKKAAGGTVSDPSTVLSQAEKDQILGLIQNKLPNASGRQISDIYNNLFIDADSEGYTRNLIDSGNLESTVTDVLGMPLVNSILSGEKPGFWSIAKAVPGSKSLAQQTLQNMGVPPEEAAAYLKSQATQLGASPENLGVIDKVDNFLNIFDYDLPKRNLSKGGPISYEQGGAKEGELMKIQAGGTHEESNIGGVPMGKDADGNMTLVEEGETVRKGDDQDFVFSDRLRLTKQDAEEFGIDKKYVGRTFAEVSEKLESRSRRKNDPIDKQTIDIQLNRLEEAQEMFKERKLAEAQEMYGGDQEEPQAPEGPQAPMQAEQGPSPEQMAIMQAMAQGATGAQGGQAPMMPPQAGGQPPMQMAHGGPHLNQQAYSNILDAVDAGAIQPGVYNDPNVIAAQTAAANAAANANPYQAATAGMTIDPRQAATPVTSAAMPGMGPEVNAVQNMAARTSTGPNAKQRTMMGAAGPGGSPPYTPPARSEFIKEGGKTFYVEYDEKNNIVSQREVPTYESSRALDMAQAAPVAANLVASGFMPEDYNAEDYRIPMDDSIVTKADITSPLQNINQVYQGARQDVSSKAGSMGELLAGLSKFSAAQTGAEAEVYDAQREQYMADIDRQMAANLEIAKTNSDMAANVDAANKALEMQKRSLQLASATELSAYADAKRQEDLSRAEIMQRYVMNPYLLNT